MSDQLISFEMKEELALVKLNRPDVLNSFNREMSFQLQSVLEKCDTNQNVRAVLITGEGKAFSAGQDLEEAVDEKGPGITNILKEQFNPIIRLLRKMEKPIVAYVNGVAAGAGANIALACDVVYASESASFIQAFSKIGLIPDSGGTYVLPRLIGWQKASALMMLGDKIGAREAEQMGMIYRVLVDAEKLEDTEAWSAAVKLSKMPTIGLGLTKRALNTSMESNLDQQLEVEQRIQTLAGSTEDYAEGVKAFLAKRKPNFTGK